MVSKGKIFPLGVGNPIDCQSGIKFAVTRRAGPPLFRSSRAARSWPQPLPQWIHGPFGVLQILQSDKLTLVHWYFRSFFIFMKGSHFQRLNSRIVKRCCGKWQVCSLSIRKMKTNAYWLFHRYKHLQFFLQCVTVPHFSSQDIEFPFNVCILRIFPFLYVCYI